MTYSELEWKGLCELYGEQNLIDAELVEDAKRYAYFSCPSQERFLRLLAYHGALFSEREDEQLQHFAKQGVKVRLK